MTNYKKTYVSSIESAGMVDGPGIRTVIFLSGCPIRCIYCHNPETWATPGTQMTTKEVFDKIVRNKSYFKNGGGVTFSGGEPLLHLDFLLEICKMLKEENIHIAVDTSGAVNSDFTKLFEYVDLFLLDIKHITRDGYKFITGFEIDNFTLFLDQLANYKNNIWIRQVIIPGINDNFEYIKGLKEYIKDIKNVTKIEFLPYHNYGEAKYEKFNLEYKLKGTPNMDKKVCEELLKYFESINV